MEILNVLTMIGGLMLTIIGFFLKKTMDELKDVKVLAADTATKLQVLQRDHELQLEYLGDRFDDLQEAVKDLTKEIKELTKAVKV